MPVKVFTDLKRVLQTGRSKKFYVKNKEEKDWE